MTIRDREPDSAEFFPENERERAWDNGFGGAITVPVKVTDKRGVEAKPRPVGRAVAGAGEGEGSPTPAMASPSAEQMAEVLKQIDFVRNGDRFWVRGVQYEVIDELVTRNAVVIRPVTLDRATQKRMKRAGRSK